MRLQVLFLYYVWVFQCGTDQPEELLNLWPLPRVDRAKAVFNIQLEDPEVAGGWVRGGEEPICAGRGVGRCFQTFSYWPVSSQGNVNHQSLDLPRSSSGSDHIECCGKPFITCSLSKPCASFSASRLWQCSMLGGKHPNTFPFSPASPAAFQHKVEAAQQWPVAFGVPSLIARCFVSYCCV